jgi:hypothetical protein
MYFPFQMKHKFQYFLEFELIDCKVDKLRVCISSIYIQVAYATGYRSQTKEMLVMNFNSVSWSDNILNKSSKGE